MNYINKLSSQPSLEGVTLEMIVVYLSEQMGWQAMANEIAIRCFTHDPSIQSSLKFLRRTPWARSKVEQLYLRKVKANASLTS